VLLCGDAPFQALVTCRRAEAPKSSSRSADMQNTSASAHRRLTIWCLTLESAGFIRRQPGVARSIEMLVDPDLNRQRAANRLPE
jgi:hypothetical protein